MYLCFPTYRDACLKPSALRGGVKTLHTQYMLRRAEHLQLGSHLAENR